MPYLEWPPAADRDGVHAAARSAAWGVVRQVLIWAFVGLALVANGKMQEQVTKLSATVDEQSRAIANLTESVKVMQANRETVKAIAEKVGARTTTPPDVPPP